MADLDLMDSEIENVELGNQTSRNIKEAAIKVLGKMKKSKQPWITQNVIDKCDERRKKKSERFDNSQKLEDYRQSNREVKRSVKAAKEDWLQQECEKIEIGIKTNNTKHAFQTLKSITKTTKSASACFEDKDGNVLTEKVAITKRWQEYCKDLYNY